MSEEQKPVPIDVRLEAATLENEKLNDAFMECAMYASVLTDRNDHLSKMGMSMANALHEIINIKGSPPISVAQTMAKKALKECEKLAIKAMEDEEQTNNNTVLCEPGTVKGSKEHDSGNVSGSSNR